MREQPATRYASIGAMMILGLASGCSAPLAGDEGAPHLLAMSDFLAAERGAVALPQGFGDPLPGLTPEELARFRAGRAAFATAEDAADGLGPVFNGDSCAACHSSPAVGGGSAIFETRFGRQAPGAPFDPLQQLGGSLQQSMTIGRQGTPPGCAFPAEVVPSQANVRALRRTNPLFGLGLVDNVPDEQLRFLGLMEHLFTPLTAGHVAVAINLSTQKPMVSRFGWKAQVPTLFQFSGVAYVDEMGITTPQFPLENCPNAAPDCALVRRCDPAPGIDDDGADLLLFTDFQRLLAPPPRGPITDEVTRGQTVFQQCGCANCHVPTLQTGPSPVAALDRVVFHPYSDFLLHDMGALGDGIGPAEADAPGVVVNATPSEMRTAPLWGVRALPRLLHDGRAATIAEAIEAHAGQGAMARDRYRALDQKARRDLLAFVGSL